MFFPTIIRLAAPLALLVSNLALAANALPQNQILLSSGSNDLQVQSMSVRVIRASVSTANAHSFETYTTYIVSPGQREGWQQIMVDEADNEEADFRSEESADSNVQSVAMFRGGNELFVVQAHKAGLTPPDLYLKKARITFHVYRFNADPDYPRFVRERTSESRSTYLDANDALQMEFFQK